MKGWFLEMAKALIKTPDNTLHVFTDYLPRFVALRKDPSEQRLFMYFDFISWLESKIEDQRSFREVIRSKVTYMD